MPTIITQLNTITTAPALPAEPSILTANTYFWSGGANASTRRRNEERHQSAVESYFAGIGMDTSRSGDSVYGEIDTPRGVVHAAFYYRESCANVYKTLRVTRNGATSNITTLRKLAALAS